GVWTGSVSVGGGVTGATLTATSGAVAGTSAAFDVQGAASSSPPTARFTASPVVIHVNETVSFDASASSDYQTPAALLQVSWDFLGTSTAAPAYPTPAAPWTAWTTTKAAANTYSTAGTYVVRLAVRDSAGDMGYATVTVVVLPAGGSLCTVTTAADVDDGATSCAGPYGTDGKLSLPEAIRLVPAGGTITFSGAMTITGSGSYSLAKAMTILAPAGVILDTKSLNVTAAVTVSGLEIAHQPLGVPITVGAAGNLTLADAYLHDFSGLSDQGTLTLTGTRVAACTADCVRSGGGARIVARYGEFRDSPGIAGIAFDSCTSAATLNVYATVFARMGTGIRLNCALTAAVQNNTFVANATGVDYRADGLTLQNNNFTGHTTTAVNCVFSNFNNSGYHLLYQNASNGCIASDGGTLLVDPLYVFPSASDYRLQPTSPAVDTGQTGLGLYLVPAFPAAPGPQFLGAGPDRGGRETY
ncbi:MAG TPA: right-handed parallel beta-helix repeat-containing protein, partial [Anaeromyxobacteraceae bacterium]